MALSIRPATAADAAAIAAVHVGSWRETYGELFPAEFLAALSIADRTRFWRETVPKSRTFVACDGAELVGFVNAGPSRELEAVEEIYCLYVRSSHLDRGAGRALMTACLADLEAPAVTLWVLEGNARARRFYERAGFVADGARKPSGIAGSDLPKMRYRKELHA